MSFEILTNGTVTTPQGFVAGAAATGMKSAGALDVTLIVSEHDCSAAGVFTKSQVLAAPVIVDKEVLNSHSDRIRGVIANAKYANACTGEPGMKAARLMQEQAALLVNCDTEQFFVLSTGVIGAQLPLLKIGSGIAIAAMNLGDHGLDAAHAIMTTDKKAKHVAVLVSFAGGTVTIGGIAKGSGMIHPNMATMLGVITTDAAIEPTLLQQCLTATTNRSFNRITIDGDSSTNDTVLLLANGASQVTIDETNLAEFQAALDYVGIALAQMIVRDGEGVTKFVEICVEGTATDEDAHTIANTIATSPLVKTAFAGGDANWGRMVAAAGRAGIVFDQYQTNLWISQDGETWLHLFENGTPTDYSEETATQIFSHSDVKVKLSVGKDSGTATVWTGDLTHEYVSINGDYRT